MALLHSRAHRRYWTHPDARPDAIATEAPAPMDPLYWNEQGEITCKRHAPYPGSDTWTNDGWREMTAADRLEHAQTLRRPAVCEVCGTAPEPEPLTPDEIADDDAIDALADATSSHFPPMDPEDRATLRRWMAERDAVLAPCPTCGHAAGAHDDEGACRVTGCHLHEPYSGPDTHYIRRTHHDDDPTGPND